MKTVNMNIKKRWYVLWLMGAAVCILHGLIEFYRRLWRGTDFTCFYYAAKAVTMGHDIIHACSGYIYPPFYAFILTPLVSFSLETSKCIWLVITLFLMILSLIFGFKLIAQAFRLRYNMWQAIGVCSLAVLFTYQSILMELMQGQSDILSLAAIIFSLYFLKTVPFLSGSLLGVAAGIKYQSIIFLPWLFLRGRWRAAFGFVAGLAVAVFAPALKLGLHNNFAYWSSALHGARFPSILWISNISLTDGVIRILLDLGGSVANGVQLIAAIGLLVFLMIWRRFRQSDIPFLWRPYNTFGEDPETAITIIEWSALILGLLIFSPEVVRRHLLILMFVNLLAAVLVVFKSPSVKRGLMILLITVNQIGILIRYPIEGHSILNHWGVPGFSLLPELLMIVIGGLALCRDVYATEQRKEIPGVWTTHLL
jgi:Glycosyltransferase family 87